MSDSGFYDNRHIYRSNLGQSRLLYEVIPEGATLRRRNPRSNPRRVPYSQTIFHEVQLVPTVQAWPDEVIQFVREPIERRNVSTARFASIVFDALMQAIRQAWNPDKFHLVLHSSGWDSRLISEALRRLYKSRGAAKMGKVLFLEINGEHSAFKAIMRREGWAPSQYAVYNEGAPAGGYHLRSVNFRDAWRRLNGQARYPFNLWWDPIEWAIERELIPPAEQVQCWAGYGANRAGVAVQDSDIASWFEGDYLLEISSQPHICEMVLPFYSLDVIQATIANGLGQSKDYRREVLEYVNPDLARIKPARCPTRNQYMRLDRRVMRGVIKAYQSSWYGRYIHPTAEPTNVIEYDDWWGAYSMASLCEHLRKIDHEFKVEKANADG